MTAITHHVSDALIDAYVTGGLAHPFAVVVAAHLSLCDACRARAEAAEILGGALLDRLDPAPLAQAPRTDCLLRWTIGRRLGRWRHSGSFRPRSFRRLAVSRRNGGCWAGDPPAHPFSR